jgi:folate-binding protein YgfZ
MLKRDDHRGEAITLAQLGVLRVSGLDSERFLQGQLSNDMARLTGGYAQPAGYHNPQGRVIALLYLVRTAADVVYAVLPRELGAIVAQRLSKFVLRAKVKIEDLSAEWRVEGLIGAQASAAPGGAGLLARFGTDGLRSLRLLPAAEAGENRGDVLTWHALGIERGEPQVYGATSEEFVAQMLNLDVLGAIGFDKGCYTGQEVIARAHYRGRVKRRMQRFRAHGAPPLLPGSAGRLADGRAFQVVDAVRRGAGEYEFLAVTALSPRAEAQASADTPLIETESLPLPYALPE